MPPPLSAIAERRMTGEDSEDDEGDTGAWRTADVPRAAGDSDIRAGYLWKKGERRKVRFPQCHGRAFMMPFFTTTALTRLLLFFFSFASSTFLPPLSFLFFFFTPDLEAAMVRAAPCAPGVLQDFGGIPAASVAGTTRRAHVHACRAQAA